MQFIKENTHEFTGSELNEKIIMTGNGHYGRVMDTGRRMIDIINPILGGTGIGMDVECLDDSDVVIFTEKEAQEFLNPLLVLKANSETQENTK